MIDCLFCKITAGEAPSTVVFQDESLFAFRDIHPVAPVHVLITPKRHITSVDDLQTDDASLAGHMILVAQQLAKKEGIAEGGYRLVFNTGADGGQTVQHLHLHLIGGRPLRAGMG